MIWGVVNLDKGLWEMCWTNKLKGGLLKKNINEDIEISKMGENDMAFWDRSNVTSLSWDPCWNHHGLALVLA
jgi:hypothetical protein